MQSTRLEQERIRDRHDREAQSPPIRGEQLLQLFTIRNLGQSRCATTGLRHDSSVKNCDRRRGHQHPLPQNDSAIGASRSTPYPLDTVSVKATACFEAELHEHRLQLDHQ
ncbi:MAG: hypothetical protein QM522_06980, partial [Chitinophagaceae bacterium]|nr:hypothetical protein [Chitinophagaceae bacterium]